MKKSYEEPFIELIQFNIQDVITTSVEPPYEGGDGGEEL